MNIPVMNTDMKQELRSESVVPAKTVLKPPVPAGSIRRDDVVVKRDKTQPDRQSDTPSREELNTLIAETKEHLESKNIKLKFNILENNDTIQVEIIDSEGKTIRKIPEDDLLKLTESLKNFGQGFLDKMS